MSDNLRHWTALGKTDPKHTKPFQRAGGFKGTATKPIWTEYRLTEHFGPCGVGWGCDEPTFHIVPAGEEILVFCTVSGWYMDEGKRATVYGVGGDKVLVKRQAGSFTDDEAYKKAFTDAVGNAFKHVGSGADVHMGLFEDSKYVAQVSREFAQDEAPRANGAKPLPVHPEESGEVTAARQRVKMLIDKVNHHIKTAPNDHALDMAMEDSRDEMAEIERAGPAGVEAAKELRARYNRRIGELRGGAAA